MIPIPAIDLRGGKAVRLFKGDFDRETVYADAPADVAAVFEEQGARRLHVVDLDGARDGAQANMDAVRAILRRVKVPVELGGGLRDLGSAHRALEAGVRWVIFGTQACLDPGFLKEALREFGERAIIGIDAVRGQVATDGWRKVTELRARGLAESVSSLGGRTIIYTDIDRDGALTGPNLKELGTMLDLGGIGVIASGGVSSLDDLRALEALRKPNLLGAIIGKALYEKKFSVADAVRTCLPSA
ncbi:MAG: 1-(5-phosphoribosyl)-5-[(5-phosphoribosylamino)methylideneamino] imidazole-4-carboxamide isomerase [Candidatus Omnitrophica bacterium]|nr:1-(5-phosphoribosyl)-5-[(5-phosphoribosylamino)methylideneamino] imidazole-4-carboxamide isomerase [Candidatus Omnitrophota bacterium]